VNKNTLGFDFASLLLEYKGVCKAFVGVPIKFLITQNGLKMRKISGWN
jgi:hypothetical protein